AERKRLAAEKRKKEAERKRLAEAKRKRDLAEKRRLAKIAQQKEIERQKRLAEQRRIERELQAKMEREATRRRAATEFGKYRTIIRDKVSRNWNRPSGSRSGLKAVVLVKVRPSGEVISARVVTGSGNPIFDRSVENAILKASPLPIPNDRTLFEYFKEFLFKFEPDSNVVSLQ
ncbi:cell envelope integrity protein TolA, partial [Pseudomonadota bacterium]